MFAPALLLLCILLPSSSAHLPYTFSDGYQSIMAEPAQTFDCQGRSYGYYADVANECKVFHVCWPILDDLGDLVETAHFSFFCGNETVFSQDSLTCTHQLDAFPCQEAEGYYDVSNAEFGRVEEV